MRKEEAQVLTEVYGGMHELAAAIHALIEKSAHEAPEVRVRHAVDLSHLEGEEVTVGAPAEPASEAPRDAKKRQKVNEQLEMLGISVKFGGVVDINWPVFVQAIAQSGMLADLKREIAMHEAEGRQGEGDDG
jgi:hypothetical protein